MRSFRCTEHEVDKNHSILVFRRKGLFEAYMIYRDDNGIETPMQHMFSTWPGEAFDTLRQFYDFVVEVAPEYYDIIDED